MTIKILSFLIPFIISHSAIAQDVITDIPPPPSTAIDTSTTTTTITTPPGTVVSPGATITQPSPPVTPSVVVTPPTTTVTTPSAIITPTTTITTTPATTTSSSTSLTTTTTHPVNLGPSMMFACSGADPNWHMDMTSSGMHFSAPTVRTTFTPTPPISTIGAMQGSILVYSTVTHDSKPITVVITKNDMGCRAAPGGSSKIDSFVILPNKVFVGCCMLK